MAKQLASPAQVAYVEKLIGELEVDAAEYPYETKQQASAAIEALKAVQAEKRAAKFAAKKAAEADAMELVSPLPEGRVKFAGQVVMTKWTDGMYGCALKCLLKDAEGRKVWMTVPRNLAEQFDEDALKGVHVEGIVTLKPKAEEPWFAFGSRPANFKVSV